MSDLFMRKLLLSDFFLLFFFWASEKCMKWVFKNIFRYKNFFVNIIIFRCALFFVICIIIFLGCGFVYLLSVHFFSKLFCWCFNFSVITIMSGTSIVIVKVGNHESCTSPECSPRSGIAYLIVVHRNSKKS